MFQFYALKVIKITLALFGVFMLVKEEQMIMNQKVQLIFLIKMLFALMSFRIEFSFLPRASKLVLKNSQSGMWKYLMIEMLKHMNVL